MSTLIIQILIIYTLIGALLIAVIGRRKPEQQKQLWIKYAGYILLIVLVMLSLLLGKRYFFWLSILISSIGLVEILKVGISSKQNFFQIFLAVSVLGIFASLFINMAYTATKIELIAMYFFVIVFDAFSQISGQLFGQRKITSISPNKTVEGLLGGTLIIIVTIFFIRWKVDVEWPFHINPLVFGLILAVLCFSGDLLASWYKRICGVKDYSKILPGQGGILDRYDSLIATGVVYYLTQLIHA